MSRWTRIHRQFRIKSDWAYFAGVVFSTHPRDLRRAIKRYRRELDADGYTRYAERAKERRNAATAALDRYFGVKPGWGALTHSTTMGLGQVLAGMKIRRDQEVLTSANEHPATIDTLKFRQDRDGTPYRPVRLFADSSRVTAREMVASVAAGIGAATRVLALAWVYSSDGVKAPIALIADVVNQVNAKRAEDDRIVFVVDGVHGFGVENSTFPELGCDFLVAGLHKAFCGPRGTAVLCGTDEGWESIVPLAAPLSGWNTGPGDRHWPGGVRAHDHWWAVADAFDFHLDVLGKSEVEARVRELSAQFKHGLRTITAVTVATPDSPDLSSGLVCFDVHGYQSSEVLAALRKDNVIATESATDSTAGRTHVRFGISFMNDEDDIERAVRSIRRIAP